MPKLFVLIEGPEADKALAELISNCEYDKHEVAIWVSDEPDKAEIGMSTLAYAPGEVD